GAVVAVAADQLQPLAGDDRYEAMPVVLNLVQPAAADRRLGAVRDDLKADRARQISRGCHRGKREIRHRNGGKYRNAGADAQPRLSKINGGGRAASENAGVYP